MRVNTRNTLAAFLAGRPARPASSIWTDGISVYSYATCIATRKDNGAVIVNRTRYSPTTSIHQNALLDGLHRECIQTIAVSPLQRGCDDRDLRIAAIL